MILNNNILKVSFILLLLNIFDVLATQYILTYNFEEANPLMNFVLQNYGYVGIYFVKLFFFTILFGGILYFANNKIELSRFTTNIIYLTCGVYGLLTIYHIINIIGVI